MAAYPPPPPYSGLPPPYSHSSSATRPPTPLDAVGSSARTVRQASPNSDTTTIQGTASSLTPSFDEGLSSPKTSIHKHQWLGEIETERDSFLDDVEKELAKFASLGCEGQTTESYTAEVGDRYGALRHDIRIASRGGFSSPSVSMFRYVCSTDLLFLIDTTSSMQSYIDAAKAQVRNIVDSMKRAFLGQAEFRMAIVGYKDHSDYPNIEFLDFTTSRDQVHSFLTRLRASGGADVPEDVLGGLRQALDATWSHQTRCIIHITDAPPHGTSLQNAPDSSDSYSHPGSEPHGLTHEPLLSRMIGLNINYGLLRINNSTDRMAYTFSEAYAAASGGGKLLRSNQYFSSSSDSRTLVNSKGPASSNGVLFEEFELGTDYSALQHLVLKMVTASASRAAMRVPRKHHAGKAFMRAIEEEEETVDVHVEDVSPRWNETNWLDETLEMEGFSPNMRLHSASTLDDMMSSVDNIKICRTQLTIRKRSQPFAQGVMRTTSYAGTASSTNQFVAKAFKKSGKTIYHMIKDMRDQALCKAFAREFNALTGSSTQLDFIVTTCLRGRDKVDTNSDDDNISLEPYIPGEYVKYNSNRRWVNKDDKGQLNELAQAFSHFSFERSSGEFMITDLQGVGHILTDPSLQTRNTKRFGSNETNLGISGFMFFFSTHECNDICRELGLKTNHTMFESNMWEFRTSWPKIDSAVYCSNKLCGKIVRTVSAKKADELPRFSWCDACWPQLKSFKVGIVCEAEGYPRHEFKASAFFYESQGQRVPRRCSKHGGDSVSLLELGIGGKDSKDALLPQGFWNKLKSPSRKLPTKGS